MEGKTFTKTMNDAFNEIVDYYKSDDGEIEKIVDFLNISKNFRSFDTGLTEFIKKHGYVEKKCLSEEEYLEDRVNFLEQKFKEKNISYVLATLKNYFLGQKRPDAREQSRKNMFKICFALDLNIDETNNFFNKIYFDRSFNIKNIDELVYYFCIKNKKSYVEAEKLIEKIKNILKNDSESNLNEIAHTSEIREKIEFFTDELELIKYIIENKNKFRNYNTTATRQLNKLLDRIIGKKEDKKVITKIQNSVYLSREDKESIKSCGLVVQDILNYKLHEFLNSAKDKNKKSDLITRNKSIHSIDFMLYVIYSSNKPARTENFSFTKNATLPDIVRGRFPSVSTFSKFRNGKDCSFDVLRRMIILLEFYAFFFDAEEEYKNEELPDYIYCDFVDQMDDVLNLCGMGPLYIGNPYDWLFMFSAKSRAPLSSFRELICEVCEFDEF